MTLDAFFTILVLTPFYIQSKLKLSDNKMALEWSPFFKQFYCLFKNQKSFFKNTCQWCFCILLNFLDSHMPLYLMLKIKSTILDNNITLSWTPLLQQFSCLPKSQRSSKSNTWSMMIVAVFSIVLITNVSNVKFKLTLSNVKTIVEWKIKCVGIKKDNPKNYKCTSSMKTP